MTDYSRGCSRKNIYRPPSSKEVQNASNSVLEELSESPDEITRDRARFRLKLNRGQGNVITGVQDKTINEITEELT